MKLENNEICRIVDGDEIAFNRFMEHYSSRLYHYTFALLGQKESAEEIVSDVFFGVWKNRKSLAEIGNMNAWIQTITYRKAISFLRKETGKYELSFDDIEDFIFEPVQSPAEEMISKEEMAKINDAIQQLPPKCKHVFFLAKIDGLPYKDIADIFVLFLFLDNDNFDHKIFLSYFACSSKRYLKEHKSSNQYNGDRSRRSR